MEWNDNLPILLTKKGKLKFDKDKPNETSYLKSEAFLDLNYYATVEDCFNALGVKDAEECCFLNRYGGLISLQMINRHLKAIKVKYQLRINNFSTHSLRKTWARRVYGRGDMALLKLSELMNHSSPAITRRYIGLRQQELGEVYDNLTF